MAVMVSGAKNQPRRRAGFCQHSGCWAETRSSRRTWWMARARSRRTASPSSLAPPSAAMPFGPQRARPL
eukprot:10978838-Lingulodinium_polyedra.AAC.1